MSDLQPVAFDIETSGFNSSSVITVTDLVFTDKVAVVLNTTGRTAEQKQLGENPERASDRERDGNYSGN
jgi:hypothetical protein